MEEQVIQLPKIEDRRGNLSFIEDDNQIPFQIARAYWIYDVPGGQKRGSHAFKQQQELIIALSGSFDVVLDDGKKKQEYHLNRSYKALYVPNRTWRYLENFSTNSLCLVLSSGAYHEDDYIRNYREFKSFLKTDATPQKEASGKELNISSKTAYTVYDCSLIELPVVKNRAGSITPVHNSETIPFDIKRVFYVYDIPAGEERGSHAHKTCHEMLVAASGSFEVLLDDGINKRVVFLNRPMAGLHIPPGIWATQRAYSSGAVCLVLASEKYEEQDYIRKYSEFKKWK